jgi:DNA-binding MarR family transcriptional regulator
MGENSEALADRFIGLVDPLRRVLIRAARSAEELPPLTEAHATLLRLLVAAGPLTPAQVADELRLSRPTVSNLVRELAADGLIERSPSAADGRSVLLVPTPRARKQLEMFGQGRILALAQALDGVSAEERDRLAAALPVLSRLLDRLTVTTDLEEKK